MIRNRRYKTWSAGFHNAHAREPIAVQMELTYRCPIHCGHCYSDCYNNPESAKDELTTSDVKRIIDKLYDKGSMWLCFTGGDPLIRRDFLELYDYAKNKGFILTIFTSMAGLSDEILGKFIESPPFSIEMTLNGATEKTYEAISQVRGSFDNVIRNIERTVGSGLPLKIKTMLTKDNIHEEDKLRKLVESFGCEFRPSTLIFARLNGDTAPCRYRISVDALIKERNCDGGNLSAGSSENRFFRCAIGNWQWHIDPRGMLVICTCVRTPSYDLLKGDLPSGVRALSDYVKNKKFSTDSECRRCGIRHACHSCPGRASLEVGDEEAPVPYFCELAKRETGKEIASSAIRPPRNDAQFGHK